ncbi:WD40 repeat domain-containing protein [Helicobacter burdigaliensis]|uniref:WD40 repeat domain-containing protein n=1 Tax=Helicobacter burdigaliensis TaxID=2315334 RepID=UPI000EF65E0B|nr:hypothetical protein [Helicobacter burdigaliensis]
MIEAKAVLRLEGSVLGIKQIENEILCIDSAFNIATIEEERVKKNIQIAKMAITPHRYAHIFSISPKRYFCVPILQEHKVIVLRYEDAKIAHKATLEDHDGDVEVSAFSHDGKLLVTGGQDGRVFFYDTQEFALLSSLMPRGDYISSIVFAKNDEFLVVCGFDKFSMIFDLVRHKIIFNFVTNDVVENACFFDNNEKLLLVCRNNSSIIFSLKEGKIISQEYLFAFWPTSIVVDEEENYAIIGTRSEYIYVISLKDNSKVMEIESKYFGVASIAFCGGKLVFGYVDGGVMIVDYNEGREELQTSLENKNYKRAREIINQNVFLSIHPLTKIFDEDWPCILEQAIALLNQDRIDEAVELSAPFMASETKKNEFEFYLAQKEGVKSFLNCLEKKDYQKAYEMLKTTKFLLKTKAYEKLENTWNKAFMNAKKLLIENASMNQRLAEQMLAPFENTPKKELIIHLLKNCDVFEKADLLIKKQNFKEYFSLTFQFSFLRDTELYKKVLLVGEKMLVNLIELEKNFAYEEAKRIAQTLLVFPNLKRAVNERLVNIQQKEALLDAIQQREIKKVYTLVDNNENLKSLQQFKDFTQDFLKRYEEAKPYAYLGNAQHIMVIFGEYMEVSYWVDKIASLMKIAYLKQIARAMGEIEVNWIMSIKRYFERFGKSIELVKLLSNHSAKEILDSFEGDGEYDGYRHYGFVENIVIYYVQKA